MSCYEDFDQLMLTNVIPFQNKNSSWIRLDGQSKGGNRKTYACFYYKGKKWKINSDTHFKELNKAHQDILEKNDPFIIIPTGKNNACIELRSGLASRPKHIYIYLK